MVDIKDETSPAVRRVVMPHVKKWLSLAPSWCHVLYVRYDSDCEHVATMIGKPQYREAMLTVGPILMEEMPESDIEKVVVHELLHMHQEEARDVFLEALEFVPEGPFRETFRGRYHYANEGAVCDLTRCIV